MKYQKFSHKTPHLKGKQHQLDPNLDLKQLVHHATVQYVDRDNDGDVDVYDNPKKKIPDENPIADFGTVSKRLIAKQKGEIKHTKKGVAYEETKSGDEGLRDWFGKSKSSDGKSGWVQLGGKWAGKPCARQPGQTSTPKCGSSKMAANLSPEEEETARRRKNRQDPNQPEKTGGAKPTNVRTEEIDIQEVKDKPGKGSGKKDACYNKVKSRYSVWPSAYASGALVKCRKVGADNWGTKTEETHMHEEERYCPLCKKRETRSECSYGEKAWDKVSVKDEEYSMARSELNTIVDAVRRLKAKVGNGEGNLEAWVQSKITKAADYIDTAADYVAGGEMDEACWSGYKRVGMKKKGKKVVPNCVPEETLEDLNGNTFAEVIDLIKPEPIKGFKSQVDEATRIQAKVGNLVMVICMWRGKSYSLKMFFPQAKLPSKKEVEEQIQKVYPGAKVIYSKVTEREPGEPFFQVEDWQKVNRQDKTDGLSQKAVNAYRRENPGSKLQTAVTEKKPTGKRAQRRKNFCSRMSGMKKRLTSTETARDPDSRINKALRRWNCN
jgi:ribosomal protein S24E